MNIFLIAGHGAGDPGATGTFRLKKYQEATETRAVLAALVTELNKYDCNVGWYNMEKNAYADWKAGKLPTSVFKNYDFVLEIHFNAFRAEDENGKTKGVECYTTTNVLAPSDKVASALCAEIATLGFTNRGAKRKNYSVIATARSAGVPAALLEVCFIDDADDMKVYTKDKTAVARAICAALVKQFDLKQVPRTSRDIVQQAAGLSDGTMAYLARYRWGKELIDKLAAAITNKK